MNAVPRRESFGTRLFNRFVPGAAPSPEIGRTVPQIKSRPSAGFFHNEMSPFLAGWNPRLREHSDDVGAAWAKAAGRGVAMIQNSGFIAGIVEVASGSTVGAGLRMAANPQGDVLGWTKEYTTAWKRKAEAAFRAWADNPIECDAAGSMKFSQIQQAAFGSYLAYGEVLALFPYLQRANVRTRSKVKLIPPSRLADETSPLENVRMGVRVDNWGLPIGYRIRKRDSLSGYVGLDVVDIAARDRDGRPNIIHVKDPAIDSVRGISVFAPVIKTHRQVDQYFDANMTSALLQTIFAATMKTNIGSSGAAFEAMMLQGEGKAEGSGSGSLEGYAAMKGDWYDSAQIDLTHHGRVVHLMPGDELEFKEAKTPAVQFDMFMGWLMREITRGVGVTYEAGTGDYRGATYSSVRMAGAIEWLTVLRRRENILVPFCSTVYEWWLDEEIATGRLEYPGGYEMFLKQRAFSAQSDWRGSPRPQADDYKTAKGYEVLKTMGATTLRAVAADYGGDWDDDMRQRAAENDLARELGLPLPWAATNPLELDGGDEATLAAMESDKENVDSKKGKPPRKKGAGRDPGDRERTANDDLTDELEAELDLPKDPAADLLIEEKTEGSGDGN